MPRMNSCRMPEPLLMSLGAASMSPTALFQTRLAPQGATFVDKERRTAPGPRARLDMSTILKTCTFSWTARISDRVP